MGPKEPHSNEKNVATRKKDGSRRHINPYSPGAGHSPPYLAGWQKEVDAFLNYLRQGQVLTNVVLTGLRGTGKTVLMEDRYKPCAQEEGWVWVRLGFFGVVLLERRQPVRPTAHGLGGLCVLPPGFHSGPNAGV